MKPLYGWVVYNGNLATEKFMDYIQWFQRAAAKQNIVVEAKKNNSLLVTIANGKPMITIGDETEKTSSSVLPDFIHFADKDLHLARHLEALGVPLFNSSKAIELCDNKAYMYQRLSTYNLPMPKTIVAPKIYEGVSATDNSHMDLIIKQMKLPLILKEAYGSFGQQVYWVNTRDELESYLERLQGKEFVFQEPVQSSIGTDLRLNVVGDKVVAAMKRTSATDFRANVTAGGETSPYTPTKEEIALAVTSAKAVGADFAGVDLLIGENGPLLCEVNSNPHIRSIYECTGINVADDMISYIRSSLSKR